MTRKIIPGRPRSRNPKHLRTEVTYRQYDALKERILTLEIELKTTQRILSLLAGRSIASLKKVARG